MGGVLVPLQEDVDKESQFPGFSFLTSHPSSHPPAENRGGGGEGAGSCLIWGDFLMGGERLTFGSILPTPSQLELEQPERALGLGSQLLAVVPMLSP